MFRRPHLVLIALTVGMVQSACGPVAYSPEIADVVVPTQAQVEEPKAQALTVVDDLGHTIEFPSHPQRIVSISASTTEILFAIGAGDKVVGRDEYSVYPEAAQEVPSVGALWEELPTEAILEMEPDLVIAAQIISEDQVLALRDLGLNVYWQANPTTYEGLWENLRAIGELTDRQSEAENLIASLNARVLAIKAKVAAVSVFPSVFYELDATDPSNPWTTGSGTFIDYIIKSAGGENVASALEGDYAQISSEELIVIDPEIILLADALYGVTPLSVEERPGWSVITAVKEGALYPIDPNMMSVPGPRLVDALEETAGLLHPELFE